MGDKVDIGLEAALAALALRQHGVVAVAQLEALGLSRSAVAKRARAGRLHRTHQGVYAVGHALLTHRGRWMAAVLACGPGAALSHADAAALWGILRPGGGTVHVTVPTTAGVQRPGIRIHRARALRELDVAERHGISVTTVARTLADLAATAPREVLRAAAQEAEIRRVLDMEALADVLAAAPRRPGVRRLRATLGIGVDERLRSSLERDFLALIRRAGLPEPDVGVQIAGWLADFSWPAARLIVEVDGERFHATRAAFVRDRERDAHHSADGWIVLRFTWTQVRERPSLVLAAVRARL